MDHLLYLIFRCDFDVMESLDFVGVFGSEHSHAGLQEEHIHVTSQL